MAGGCHKNTILVEAKHPAPGEAKNWETGSFFVSCYHCRSIDLSLLFLKAESDLPYLKGLVGMLIANLDILIPQGTSWLRRLGCLPRTILKLDCRLPGLWKRRSFVLQVQRMHLDI
jgi:hypothetical protein